MTDNVTKQRESSLFYVEKLTMLKCSLLVLIVVSVVINSVDSNTSSREIDDKEGCKNICSCRWNQKMNKISAVCESIPAKLDHNIKSVKVKGAVIIQLHKLIMISLNDVEELDLSECHVKFITRAFSKGNKFRIIRLSSNKIPQIMQQDFGNMNFLEELYLDNNVIKTVESGTFNNMIKLKIIHLENNNVKDIQFITFLPPSIRELNLYNNNIEEIPEDNEKSSIEMLNLCGNSVARAVGIFRMSHLQQVCLEGITYMPIKGLKPSLKSLILTGAGNNEPILMSYNISLNIANLKQLLNLTIVNYEIPSLKFMKELAYLKKIELIKVKTSDQVDIMDALRDKPDLKELNLNQSNILAHQLLQKYPDNIPKFLALSLQKTDMKTLENYNGQTRDIIIDIQQNPLDCTLSNWLWIKNRQIQSHKLFVDESELVCQYPRHMKGIKFIDAMTQKPRADSHTGKPGYISQGYRTIISSTIVMLIILALTFNNL